MGTATCFKAYDIRGRIPDELNTELVQRIAFAYAKVFNPNNVVVGRDIRLTSEGLANAVTDGLRMAGVNVYDVGLCGTENVYFATFDGGFDGGIMVTASHNPMDYNGLKLVEAEARPIGIETGLKDIQDMVEDDDLVLPESTGGSYQKLDVWDKYIQHLLTYIEPALLKPLKVVMNPGNGGASLVIERILQYLPFEVVKLDYEVNGSFPNGIPNPLLPENQQRTSQAVVSENADMGIAWDGDYDRCFLFDESGGFVNGYYLTGLLTMEMLNAHPGASIVHDPRLTWNTLEVIDTLTGKPLISKTGHSYIKRVMRDNDAVYGGEISSHHYFRDFSYCDSGMIPWLLTCSVLSRSGRKLSELISEYQQAYPASDEINRRVESPDDVMQKIESHYAGQELSLDHIDGLSMEFSHWRFNMRKSNTEPLLRLNVETRGDPELLKIKIQEVLSLYEDE